MSVTFQLFDLFLLIFFVACVRAMFTSKSRVDVFATGFVVGLILLYAWLDMKARGL